MMKIMIMVMMVVVVIVDIRCTSARSSTSFRCAP